MKIKLIYFLIVVDDSDKNELQMIEFYTKTI